MTGCRTGHRCIDERPRGRDALRRAARQDEGSAGRSARAEARNGTARAPCGVERGANQERGACGALRRTSGGPAGYMRGGLRGGGREERDGLQSVGRACRVYERGPAGAGGGKSY